MRYFVKEDDPNDYFDRGQYFYIVDEDGNDIWTSVRFGTKEEALHAIEELEAKAALKAIGVDVDKIGHVSIEDTFVNEVKISKFEKKD